jgi:hypothetical protein
LTVEAKSVALWVDIDVAMYQNLGLRFDRGRKTDESPYLKSNFRRKPLKARKLCHGAAAVMVEKVRVRTLAWKI